MRKNINTFRIYKRSAFFKQPFLSMLFRCFLIKKSFHSFPILSNKEKVFVLDLTKILTQKRIIIFSVRPSVFCNTFRIKLAVLSEKSVQSRNVGIRTHYYFSNEKKITELLDQSGTVVPHRADVQ